MRLLSGWRGSLEPPTAFEVMEPLQSVNEAEPANELFFDAPLPAKSPADRLTVEIDVEPDTQHAVLVGTTRIVHRTTVGGITHERIGELPCIDP